MSCVCSVLSSGGWIVAVRNGWARKLQSVHVRRKSIGKKHCNCIERLALVLSQEFVQHDLVSSDVEGGGGPLVLVMVMTECHPTIHSNY